MKDKYDIVVIGSGIGGLVSAALLADHGKKILVIEKEPKPGGYLSEFKNEDFIFDVSLHLLNGCGEGNYAHSLFKKCGIIDEIKFVKPKYLYRTIFPDFDIRVPQANLGEYKDILARYFPKHRKNVENLFTEMSSVARRMHNLTTTKRMAPILPYLKNKFGDILNKHIRDTKLKAIICQLWLYLGLPPSLLRGADFCYPWYDYTHNGGYYVERGSYTIVKALVNYIKGRGGEFLFNKSVGRISIKDGLCKTIMFGKNEVACDMVISNLDLTKTVYELIGSREFLPSSIKKLKNIQPSLSAFEIFLGLNADLRASYPDDYEIFVNSGYDINKQYRAFLRNNARNAPFVITLNSNINPSSAPEGKSVATIIMLSGYDYWISRSQEEYQDKKQKVADILMRRAAKIIPEIATSVHKNVVSTPVTFERYTNNTRGAIYGYSRTSGQNNEIRPNDIKEIKNLYFASAWAKQGSGVAKVLGVADSVSKKILRPEIE